MANNRILTSELLEEDKISNIRPESLDEYIGQTEAKENLRIFIMMLETIYYFHTSWF